MQHPVHVTTRCYGLPKHSNIWPTYDSLYGLATKSPPPRLTQRTVKTGTSIYQPRPTSAAHNDRQLHSKTRPTSPFRNDRPAAFNDSTDLTFPQRSSSCIQRLDRPHLPATIVQLHSTTRLTSAYLHQTSSCISSTRPAPATLVDVQLRTSTTQPYPLSTSSIW